MNLKRKFSQVGQSLAEFALLLPVMVIFIMVIFDLGRAAYYFSAIHNGAREGARQGSVRWYDATITTDIQNSVKRLTAGLDADQMSVNSTYLDTDFDGENDTVRVTVTYQFHTATPVLTRLLGQAGNVLTLSSQARMRIEL